MLSNECERNRAFFVNEGNRREKEITGNGKGEGGELGYQTKGMGIVLGKGGDG